MHKWLLHLDGLNITYSFLMILLLNNMLTSTTTVEVQIDILQRLSFQESILREQKIIWSHENEKSIKKYPEILSY